MATLAVLPIPEFESVINSVLFCKKTHRFDETPNVYNMIF